ncbi:MAG: EF-P beta-lysylation protein EpmB [Gammaproteobacteria bacterium]|nr:EF-P beta-lysylation protein EpmB [Gammaproteobacteria bacterium]
MRLSTNLASEPYKTRAQTGLATWQTLLKEGIEKVTDLLELLGLDKHPWHEMAIDESSSFKLRVPHGFVNRMKRGDPNDPLLLQILPLMAEKTVTPNYSVDPLGEKAHNPVPGLLHKYKSRVLLTMTGACAINCRYCFRRHFPYEENNPGRLGWQSAIDYIKQDTRINEVIFSGGDPLILPDHVLAPFSEQLAAIPHLTTLRIHTRLPIVLPERINDEFLDWFAHSRLKPVLVTHANHPNEIDESVASAAKRLQQADIFVLNQSVLLKNVNDNPSALATLSEKLFACHIMPYYIHLLDKVEGAAHFDLPEATAIAIHQELVRLLPGYLVPKLVCEIGGEASKTSVGNTARY